MSYRTDAILFIWAWCKSGDGSSGLWERKKWKAERDLVCNFEGVPGVPFWNVRGVPRPPLKSKRGIKDPLKV